MYLMAALWRELRTEPLSLRLCFARHKDFDFEWYFYSLSRRHCNFLISKISSLNFLQVGFGQKALVASPWQLTVGVYLNIHYRRDPLTTKSAA